MTRINVARILVMIGFGIGLTSLWGRYNQVPFQFALPALQ